MRTLRRFSLEEIQILTNEYPHMTAKELAVRLGRSVGVIRAKVRELGIRKATDKDSPFRICTKCFVEKPKADDFYQYKIGRNAGKYYYWCKVCTNSEAIKWSKDRRELTNKRSREWRQKNRHSCSEYNKAYDRLHPEKRRVRHAKVMSKRKLSVNNTQFSHHSLEEWEALIEKYDHTCLCCKKQEPEIRLTVDHIIPLSKSFSDDCIDNIQCLCGSCNSSKGTKIIDYRPQGNIMAQVYRPLEIEVELVA